MNNLKVDNIGVHRTHCCKKHGCKYFDKDCPVILGLIIQDYPCEDCTQDKLEYPEETEGSRIAREIRAACNELSEEQREIHFNQALDRIYKNYPEQDPRKWIDEEKMLDSICGEPKTWNGFQLGYCKLCDCAIIHLECCGNSSCSGGGCKICCGDSPGFPSTDFSFNTKHYPEDYLTQDEIQVKTKIEFLRKYILESLAAGFNEINWKYLHESDKTCDLAYDLFDELKEFKNE